MAIGAILTYTDYRLFLKDCLDTLRETRPWFSLRYLATQLELDPGNLVKVLQKERHLPDRCLKPLATELGLNLRESDYLEHLVRFAKARNSKREQEAYEKLLDLKGAKAEVLGRDQYAFYKDWRCTAVLAMLHLDGLRTTESAIAEHLQPRSSPDDVHRILLLLEELGLARRGKGGKWIASKSSLTTGEAWRDLAVRAFQRETLSLALGALDQIPKEDRDISTLTVTLDHDDLAKVRALALDFRKAVLDLATKAPRSDRVWQLNLQFFPLSKPIQEHS